MEVAVDDAGSEATVATTERSKAWSTVRKCDGGSRTSCGGGSRFLTYVVSRLQSDASMECRCSPQHDRVVGDAVAQRNQRQRPLMLPAGLAGPLPQPLQRDEYRYTLPPARMTALILPLARARQPWRTLGSTFLCSAFLLNTVTNQYRVPHFLQTLAILCHRKAWH